MKRTDLNKLGLEKEMIGKILYLHQRDTEAHKKVLEAKQKEVQTTKEKLVVAGEKIKALNKVVKQYEGIDLEELRHRAINIEKEYVIKELFNDKKFTSKLAQKAARDEFIKQQFIFQNGTFFGVEEFFIKLQEEDPTAFITKSTSIITTGVVHQ